MIFCATGCSMDENITISGSEAVLGAEQVSGELAQLTHLITMNFIKGGHIFGVIWIPVNASTHKIVLEHTDDIVSSFTPSEHINGISLETAPNELHLQEPLVAYGEMTLSDYPNLESLIESATSTSEQGGSL